MGAETVSPTPRPQANQAVGLLAFVVGIALLLLVFYWVYQLYEGLNPQLFGVHAATAVSSSAAVVKAPATALQASPGTGAPVWPTLGMTAARLLTLLVLGWLASLIAARGAAMAWPDLPRK